MAAAGLATAAKKANDDLAAAAKKAADDLAAAVLKKDLTVVANVGDQTKIDLNTAGKKAVADLGTAISGIDAQLSGALRQAFDHLASIDPKSKGQAPLDVKGSDGTSTFSDSADAGRLAPCLAEVQTSFRAAAKQAADDLAATVRQANDDHAAAVKEAVDDLTPPPAPAPAPAPLPVYSLKTDKITIAYRFSPGKQGELLALAFVEGKPSTKMVELQLKPPAFVNPEVIQITMNFDVAGNNHVVPFVVKGTMNPAASTYTVPVKDIAENLKNAAAILYNPGTAKSSVASKSITVTPEPLKGVVFAGSDTDNQLTVTFEYFVDNAGPKSAEKKDGAAK